MAASAFDRRRVLRIEMAMEAQALLTERDHVRQSRRLVRALEGELAARERTDVRIIAILRQLASETAA